MTTTIVLPTFGEAGSTWNGKINTAITAVRDAADAAAMVTSVSLATFGVLPAASAATNVAGFAAAASSAFTAFHLPAGTYNVQLTEGGNLMSFVGKNNITIVGDNAIINDTTTYTNNGAFTTMFKFDNCRDVRVSGIEYVGPVLGSPTTLLGYQGAIVVRAVSGTNGLSVDVRATNCRYGLQTGDYGDATKGNCKNLSLKLRGTKVGYAIAAYYAEGIRHDIDVDGVHRAAYIAGCDDVTGVARWKDQYNVADIAYLITDAIISGTDAGANTVSRGCTNLDVTSIDKGSTVFQPSSRCAGITLSRVDPGTAFRNIRVRVYSKGSDTVSTTVGAWVVVSAATAVWARYPFNWESTILLENIEVSGVIDHSAATLAGNTGSEFYVYAFVDAAHAATVRNFRVQDLTILTSSATAPRASFFYAVGVASPTYFDGFTTPGLGLRLLTNAAVDTVLRGCVLESLDVSGVTGGSRVVVGSGTKIVAAELTDVPITNTSTAGGTIGGAGAMIKQKEITLTLTGASTSWTQAIPTGGMVLAVQGRVTTAITGATGYTIGPAAEAARYVNTNTTTAGSTFGPANAATTEFAPRIYTATTDLVVTAKTSNFTAGAIRLTLSYLEFPALTV